jgi:hypothetical protein
VLLDGEAGLVAEQPIEEAARASPAVAAMTFVWKGPYWSETWV